MIVKIYEEAPVLPKEKEITLRLVQNEDSIVVAVVDGKGEKVNRGNLVVFQKGTGMLKRCVHIDPKIGLPLNKGRQLCMVGE